MFPNLTQAGKKPVLNAGTESGPERGCSQMLGMGNFPEFLWKNPVPRKWYSGNLYHIRVCVDFFFKLNLLPPYLLQLSHH